MVVGAAVDDVVTLGAVSVTIVVLDDTGLVELGAAVAASLEAPQAPKRSPRPRTIAVPVTRVSMSRIVPVAASEADQLMSATVRGRRC